MGIWTDKKIEKLKALWEKGVPTAEIGKRLDFSKNAIVGKVHRLGLSNRNSPIKTSSINIGKVKKSTPKPEEQVSKSVKSTKVTEPKKTQENVEVKEKIQQKTESQKSQNPQPSKVKKVAVEGVTLSELTSDRCCWPIDDVNSDNFHFCGRKVFKNKPYCLEHCAMAYTVSSSANSRGSTEKRENSEKKENKEE
ncbi:MAG: hypothetical protein IJ638_02940 [Alphaproteobacteria bacterium]|nr:hypothetical protein [Alphaproteobacteria bacterium]